MLNIWLYSLGSVIIISLLSLIGIFTLWIKTDRLKKMLIYMISFSAGALLGDAFLHLLPEIVEETGFTIYVSLYVLLGIAISFVLEKIIHWRHCHHPTTDDHPHPFAWMNLFGDGVHNFIDGLIIGAAYLISIPVGIATTLAVILHEIPQEIGDFGVLLHGGFSKKKALLLNFVTALTAIFGVVLALVVSAYVGNITHFLVPFAAGGFIYIATADLIPELHKETKMQRSLMQIALFVLGIVLMLFLMQTHSHKDEHENDEEYHSHIEEILESFIPTAYASNSTINDVDLLLFYGQGCPHCAAANMFLEELSSEYPSLKVSKYEVYFDQDNTVLFQDLAFAFDSEVGGVPTVFIDDQMITGFNDSIGQSVEVEVQKCLEEACIPPLELLEENDFSQHLTIPAVVLAAAVDAINPCAFAVLIILLTTILATKNRRRALFSGLAFALSIYISYFLMGLGLYSAVQVAGFTHIFYVIVAILAVFIGLFNLKDYFAYGKWFVMEVPMSWRPKLNTLIKSVVSVPGAFFIGFAVSLFLLPCTSGPYIVILGLLASATERTYAIALLLLYNFIFILPMLLITGAVYFGFTTTEAAEEWRQKKLKILHLVAGIIILLLGAFMLIALKLGYL
jgi:zinc and cadmium transporter